jgi:ketosteroid isomerase-like protein
MGEIRAGETIRAGIEAFNAGDHDGVLRLLADDVEWKRVDGLPDEGGGMIHGRDAVREFMHPEVFAAARVEILALVEGDGVVLVHGRFHARGAGTGIELDTETFVVYWIEDGLAVRVENWRRREDAERSSGLSLG